MSEKYTESSIIQAQLSLNPLDGRYYSKISSLVKNLSEAALNRNRLSVEIEWLIHLTNNKAVPGIKPLQLEQKHKLRNIVKNFDNKDILAISKYESMIRHDVKAVEYYLKDKIHYIGLSYLNELVHFGCTSEDINNLAYAICIREAMNDTWIPKAKNLIKIISDMAYLHRNVSMLSRTHGQPATPTTMGKELAVAAYRLKRQLKRILNQEYLGKINGATGTYAAHYISCPNTDWQYIAKSFVEKLDLKWNPLTTQIEPHDWQCELYEIIIHFNMILHNLCTDIWTYISLGFFEQSSEKNEVGSSTMPHKVNPIRFENAEANLEISNSLLNVLKLNLITSRMQRDLTDSSMQRNIGISLGYSVLAIVNISNGLKSLLISSDVLKKDLHENWNVLSEAIQTIMRVEAIAGNAEVSNPYEKLKELTRGKHITKKHLDLFVNELNVSSNLKNMLKKLTPDKYNGIAAQLVDWLNDDEGSY